MEDKKGQSGTGDFYRNRQKRLQEILAHPGVQEHPHLLFLIRSYQALAMESTFQSIERLFVQWQEQAAEPGKIRSLSGPHSLLPEEVVLGRDPGTGHPVTLAWSDFMKNIIVAGAQGSGKTSLLRRLLLQSLQRQTNFLAFQKKLCQFEFLAPDPQWLPTRLRLDQVRDALFESATLNDDDDPLHWYRRILSLINDITQREDSRKYSRMAVPLLVQRWPRERIVREGFPTVTDLLQGMEEVFRREGPSRDAQLYRSMGNVWGALWQENEIFHARRGMYCAFRRHPTVIVYGVSEEQAVWIVALLQAARLCQENDPRPPEQKTPFLIVMDDVQDLIEAKTHTRLTPFISYMNIARENRLGFLLSFQSTLGVEEKLLSSAGVHIIGRLPNGEEALRVTRMLGLHPNYASMLQTLPPGRFLLRSPSSNGVVMFQSDPLDSPQPSDPEQWKKENEARRLTLYAHLPMPDPSPLPGRTEAHAPPPPAGAESSDPTEIARRLLNALALHPFAVMSHVQRCLGLSSSVFHPLVEQLERRGWLRRHTLSRCKALELLPPGYEKIHLTPMPYHGRYPHDFGLHWIEEHYRRRGWKVRREESLPGSAHRIDLVARQEDRLIAVEYETGASTISLNATQCLKTEATEIRMVLQEEKLRKSCVSAFRRDPPLARELERGRLVLETLWTFLQAANEANE